MARVKRAQNRKTRSKKLFSRAKGFFGSRKNTRKQANEAVMKARANAYTGRKQRKRQFRQLWIIRISAAVKQHDLNYSQFMHGLSLAGITMNRKMISELAIANPDAFKALVEQAKAALA